VDCGEEILKGDAWEPGWVYVGGNDEEVGVMDRIIVIEKRAETWPDFNEVH